MNEGKMFKNPEKPEEELKEEIELPPPLTKEEKERRAEIRKELVETINKVLRVLDFKKKASTWKREFKEVIQIVNLQRSQFSFSFYLNLGIFIKRLEEDKSDPKEYECHHGNRFEFIAAEDGGSKKETNEIANYLNFEDTSMTPEEKIENVERIIEEKILPFFTEFDSSGPIINMKIERLRRDLAYWRSLKPLEDGWTVKTIGERIKEIESTIAKWEELRNR